MSIQLKQEEHDALRRYVDRKRKPTIRQKALALLGLAEGESLESLSIRLGITKVYLSELVARFSEERLAVIGLLDSGVSKELKRRRSRYETIEKTPDVCGGAARVAGTRIPVWQLVEARDLGASEAQLLIDFPRLRALNLVEAWDYASENQDEIAAEIHRNQEA